MRRFSVRGVVWTMLGVLVVLPGLGCGGSNAGSARYVPDATSARQALETALAAWQRGESAGRIAASSPPIEVVDTRRPAGKKLAGFDIVGEEGGDGPRWFTVRLKFDSDGDAEEVRYAVVGRDPIWVFRDADYSQIGAM